MLDNLPKSVRIVEVGARDGLQNEKTVLNTADKAKFISMLVAAGVQNLEITSFVRPERIPQMSDAKELFEIVSNEKYFKSISSPCLVPNLKGLEKAIELGVSEIAVFTATSNTFNKKNINVTVDESFDRLAPVIELALSKNIKVRGYASTVFGCPYEGATSVDTLISVCKKLFELGCYEVSLGDTIGCANPLQVKEIILELDKHFDLAKFSMHFHDTNGVALANILTSLEMGIVSFDSSAGGLGGCPYAEGATGNVATEDVIYMLSNMGIETGINMKKLTDASEFILNKLNKKSLSKAYTYFKAQDI